MTSSRPPSDGDPSALPPRRPPPRFISSRRAEAGGSIRLILAGHLDLMARRHFESDLGEALDDADRVQLDLRALTFLDCACLGTIFAAAARARREGVTLILTHPRGQVRRLLDLVGPPPSVTVLDLAMSDGGGPIRSPGAGVPGARSPACRPRYRSASAGRRRPPG